MNALAHARIVIVMAMMTRVESRPVVVGVLTGSP